MIIGIDFDGTCVTHEFPQIGKDIGAVPILKELVDRGHELILFTMRSNVLDDNNAFLQKGNYLDDAVNWFKENGIELYGIQTNPTQKAWTSSPKAHCQLYIDDAALGCPLITNYNISKLPFVDWTEVERYLRDVYDYL